MSNKKMSKKAYLLALLHQQVQPALGCTEIGIVSLAAAKAAKLLPGKVVGATVYVSPYVYRNDGRVGVPKLGKCGMKVITAAGLILQNPEKKLNCLDDLTPATINQAFKFGAVNNPAITEEVDYNAHPVYTKVLAWDNKGNKAEAIIKYMHDNIVSAKLNGKETLKTANAGSNSGKDVDFDKIVDDLKIKDAFEICKKLSMKDIEFLNEGVLLNQKVRLEGLKHPEPHSLSKVWQRMLNNESSSFGFAKESWTSQILGYLCAAVDARMYGCPLPVMSSARSGDHGLTVTVPQNIHAKFFRVSKLKLLQSVAFAHYITWKIKSKIGHLCGMCGSALAAGAATTCGIAFQRDWSWNRIQNLLNMHLASQVGIVCDGAKPSCSFKIMSSMICGFMCLTIVENGGKIDHKDGVVHKNVEETINNLKSYSHATQSNCVKAMVDIMTKMAKLDD